MDWYQTLTIIGTTLAAVVYIHKDIKADMKERQAEYSRQFEENRKEFAETRKLWASLLDKIHKIELEIKEIKLFISPSNKKDLK